MYFKQLIHSLSQVNTINVINNTNFTEFSDIAFLDGQTSEYNPQTLYLGYIKQLDSNDTLPIHCILSTTDILDNSYEQIEDLAIIDEQSLFSIFNQTKLILEQSEGKGLYEELLHTAEKSHNIQAVVNSSAIKLGNPLILIDLDFKVISYSTISPITDELWRKNTERGYCSYEFKIDKY